jgi:signal transduction histidine kinase
MRPVAQRLRLSTLRWSSLRLRTKGFIVVGIAVLPVVVFWAAVAVAVVTNDPPSNTTARSLTVQASLARVQSDLLDADAGARDFLLTDNPKARERHRTAIARLGADLAVLDNAVIDRTLRKSLTALQNVVADEVAVLARLTRAPAPSSPVLPPMGERAALDRSVANLDRIRFLATSMDKGQTELTALRSAADQRTERAYFLAFLIGSVVCVAAGLLSAQALSRSISRRVAVLARNTDRLALGLALEPLPPGEDEVARVDARLRQTARLLLRREDDLRERSRELEAANRELEAFSYSVSHDLRAPLRAIEGFSAAIEQDCQGQLNAAGTDALRRVRAAARRMGILIDELLNLSHLTRTELRRTRVDIAASANAILGDLARHGAARQVDIRIEPGLTVDADAELAKIALQNLLSNAWKYTGRTPYARIEVGSTLNGLARVFHVRDNGAGFDMAHSGKLFGAFQRLHTEREFDGTGIGLAIVQRIVNRHGGRIWAESRVNEGATFYFTFEPERAPQ